MIGGHHGGHGLCLLVFSSAQPIQTLLPWEDVSGYVNKLFHKTIRIRITLELRVIESTYGV